MRSVAGAVIVAIVTLLITSACGGGEKKSASSETSASVPFDRAFIDAMVPHHRSAIEMAKAAQTRGLQSKELERMAADIVASQQREIDQMLDWRETWFGSRKLGQPNSAVLGVPESNMGMSGMNHDSEQIAQAEDVDMTFAELMIAHHEGAVAMAEAALGLAEHEEIRKLAEAIIAAQNREIEILKKHSGGAH